MSFDLVTAHSRLGLTDASKDYYVNLCLDTAKAIAEKYCDRAFDFATETVKFYDFTGKQLHLQRYPLTAVTSVNGDGATVATTGYKAHLTGGYLEFFHPRHYKELTVSYSGGYATLPPDLALALWCIFDSIWAETPGAGSTAGGAGISSGSVDSISLPDIGTIKFSSGGAGSASGAAGTGGYITDLVANLLAPYRRLDA